jgi:hypothetical protein
VLLGQRLREREAREKRPRDEYLAKQPSRPALLRERLVELANGEKALVDEERPQWSPRKGVTGHGFLIGTGGRALKRA